MSAAKAQTSGTVVKHHLGFKSQVLVRVSAHAANLQALAPLQSEVTSSLHFAFEAQRHKVACSQTLYSGRCSCTGDVVQSVYK